MTPEEQYVVVAFTFGSFRDFQTDPMTLDEAHAFVADPPDWCKPRPQDSLRIYELTEVER